MGCLPGLTLGAVLDLDDPLAISFAVLDAGDTVLTDILNRLGVGGIELLWALTLVCETLGFKAVEGCVIGTCLVALVGIGLVVALLEWPLTHHEGRLDTAVASEDAWRKLLRISLIVALGLDSRALAPGAARGLVAGRLIRDTLARCKGHTNGTSLTLGRNRHIEGSASTVTHIGHAIWTLEHCLGGVNGVVLGWAGALLVDALGGELALGGAGLKTFVVLGVLHVETERRWWRRRWRWRWRSWWCWRTL